MVRKDFPHCLPQSHVQTVEFRPSPFSQLSQQSSSASFYAPVGPRVNLHNILDIRNIAIYDKLGRALDT
jgi:hypothetical protein